MNHSEFGMGYRLVQIEEDFDSGPYDVIIFNDELLVPFSELNTLLRMSIEKKPEEIVRDAKEIDSFRVIKNYKREEDNFFDKSHFPGSQKPQIMKKIIFKDNASISDKLKRFSAFKNDRRLDIKNGKIYAGSYATTSNDAQIVLSGLSAVGRFALPNPFPAIYAYTLDLKEDTDIIYGTVRPMFNQAGGGVEVFFDSSCLGSITQSILPIG